MKKYILALIAFAIGIGCSVAYNVIGSEVAPDGTLIEPFYLIPMGYLFIFIGVILVIVFGIGSLIHKSKKANQ